ncbi:MAG: hypothetical protein U5K51_06575 [Flavobacteriaceae bacterium]|nr:hypothetical protein [Flavobacteriaceae bacterium]
MKANKFALILLLSVCLGSLEKSLAQESSSKNWHYLAELYLMFPNMSGETALGNLPAVEVDAEVSDIFGSLEMGAMFYLEAGNDDWAISSDFIYMKLGQDIEPGAVVTSGDLTMKQYAWEMAALKRVTPWLDAGLAGRLNKLEVALDLDTVLNSRSGSDSETWIDPVIVVRSNHIFNEKWLTQLRLDAGGFGIGSDFTWQLQANVGYRFSERFQTSLGYRYIGIDYDDGEGADRFLYDMDTFGFVARLGINF